MDSMIYAPGIQKAKARNIKTFRKENAKLSHMFTTLYEVVIPVVARSKAWVCGRLLVGTAGSNPAGGTDVCLF